MGWQGDDNEGCIPQTRPRATNRITNLADGVGAAAEAVGEYVQAPPSMWDTIERLIRQRVNPALSSRDAEVREVLEGLASKVYVSFKGQYCWCRLAGLATRPDGDRHDLHCARTRTLYGGLRHD